MDSKGCVRILLLLIFSACFTLQVSRDFLKYLKRSTTVTSTVQTLEEIELPNIIVCAQNGFNESKMRKFRLDQDFWVGSKVTEPAFSSMRTLNKTRADFLWNQTTFEASDLIIDAHFGGRKDSSREDLRILPVSSYLNGQCFLVESLLKIKNPYKYNKTAPLKLVLNHSSSGGDFSLYLFNKPTPLFSLPLRFWFWQPLQRVIRPDTSLKISMKTVIKEKDPTEELCNPSLDDEFSPCVPKVLEDGCLNDGPCCYMPQFRSVPFMDRYPLCNSSSSLRRTNDVLRGGMAKAHEYRNCRFPCRTIGFWASVRTDFIPGRRTGKSYVTLYFPDTRAKVEGVYTLFDFNSILASIGGSMGLFLGFSFLDSAFFILEKVKRLNWQCFRPQVTIQPERESRERNEKR